MSAAAILEELLRLSFGAAALALLVAGAQFLFRRHLSPGARSALWLLVVARLLLPVSFESDLSVDRLIDRGKAAAFIVTPSSPPALPTPVESSNDLDSLAPRANSPSADENNLPVRSRWEISTVLFALWLSGCGLLGLVLLVSTLREGRRLAQCVPCTDENLLARWRECATRMKVTRIPEIRMSRTSIGPGLFGFLRPKLLLPADFTTDFSLREQEAILLHELAHVQRRDLPLNWLIAGLQILHWFNPFLWLAFARWRTDREIACDARAVELMGAGASREFGQALLRVLEHDRPILSGSIRAGFRERHRELRRRLAAVAKFSPGRRRPALAIAVAGVLAAVGLTDAQVVESPGPAEPEFSHIAFVIDTSGSMRSFETNLLWPVVGEIMQTVFDDHPDATDFAVLTADGTSILDSNSSVWTPNGPISRSEAIATVGNFSGDSRSNPVPGLIRALNDWGEADGTRLYLCVIGDENTQEVEPALQQLRELNPVDENGRHRASINAFQLPVFAIPATVRTAESFRLLMSTVAEEHDGAYRMVPNLYSIPAE